MTNEVLAGEPAKVESRDGRVLVVDDSRVVRRLVSGWLRKVGYSVVEAESGKEAIPLLQESTFDVVVTDLSMPDVDGFGVLEAARASASQAEVVILTGTHAHDISAAVRALRLGAHDFVSKPPAGAHEVIVTVDRAVEKRRLRLANVKLMKELEALSRTDALTGVWNRRAFDEALRREVLRASRHNLPLTVMLLDIDHFKQVNDTFSHQVGDEVLKWFALHVSRILREGDTFHRYGGEEFAVLLPHTDEEGAHLIAGRILEHVATAPFQSTLRLTTSIGSATAKGAQLDEVNLLPLADTALYQAKRSGRNCAVTYGSDAARSVAGVAVARGASVDAWARLTRGPSTVAAAYEMGGNEQASVAAFAMAH